jgi:hypothetical protein
VKVMENSSLKDEGYPPSLSAYRLVQSSKPKARAV